MPHMRRKGQPPFHNVRVAIGAGGSALVLALVIGSLSTAGVIDMTAAWSMLAAAWMVGAIAIAISEPVWGLPTRHRIFTGTVSAVALGAALALAGVYEYSHHPGQTESESGRSSRLVVQRVVVNPPKEQENLSLDVFVINKGTLPARRIGTWVRMVSTPTLPNTGSDIQDMLDTGPRQFQFDHRGHFELEPNDDQKFFLNTS